MSARSLINKNLEDRYYERVRKERDNNPDVYLKYPKSEKPIPSLKAYLQTHSLFFKAHLSPPWINNTDDMNFPLKFSDSISVEIFKILHNYIFDPREFDADSMSLEEQFELFELISFYQFGDLKEVMNEYFIENMTLDDCWELLILSYRYDELHLGDVCGQFIAENENNLESNFKLLELNAASLAFLLRRDTFHLSEEEIFRIARAWELDHPNEDITPIKQSIRIPLATDVNLRREMIDWCETHVREYGPRRVLQNGIPNLAYFS